MECKTRAATVSDVDAIVEMGEAMAKESVYSDLGFSMEKVRKLAGIAIQANWFVRIVERNGEVAGMMAAYCLPHWFSDVLTCSDILLYVKPEHRGGFAAVMLVSDFQDWARNTGAKLVTVGVTASKDPDSVVDFYRARGFVPMGAVLRMEL